MLESRYYLEIEFAMDTSGMTYRVRFKGEFDEVVAT